MSQWRSGGLPLRWQMIIIQGRNVEVIFRLESHSSLRSIVSLVYVTWFILLDSNDSNYLRTGIELFFNKSGLKIGAMKGLLATAFISSVIIIRLNE
jgi:hypothetical protein